MRCPSCQQTFAVGKEGRRAWFRGRPYQCDNCRAWFRFNRKKDFLTLVSGIVLVAALLLDFQARPILIYGLVVVAVAMVLYAVKLPSLEAVAKNQTTSHNNNHRDG